MPWAHYAGLVSCHGTTYQHDPQHNNTIAFTSQSLSQRHNYHFAIIIKTHHNQYHNSAVTPVSLIAISITTTSLSHHNHNHYHNRYHNHYHNTTQQCHNHYHTVTITITITITINITITITIRHNNITITITLSLSQSLSLSLSLALLRHSHMQAIMVAAGSGLISAGPLLTSLICYLIWAPFGRTCVCDGHDGDRE